MEFSKAEQTAFGTMNSRFGLTSILIIRPDRAGLVIRYRFRKLAAAARRVAGRRINACRHATE
jgi:hypothetical protein